MPIYKLFKPKLDLCILYTVADPGFPVGEACIRWGGVDLRRGHFLVKMYAKMKELGPIGGRAPGTPPRSANGTYIINVPHYYYFSISLRRNQTLLQHFFHVQSQKCCIPYFIRFSLLYPLVILYECIDNIPAGSSFRIQIYILLWMQLSTFMTTYIYTCSCVVWSFPIEFNTE